MRRLVPSIVPLVPVLLLAACTDAPQPTAPGDARRDELEAPVAGGQLGDPLPGLSTADSLLFGRGKYLFQKRFGQSKGLGPTFNARSCAQCHGEVVTGEFSGTGSHLQTQFTRLNADGSCSNLANHGGFVKQDSVTQLLQYYTDFHDEPLPAVTHEIARRTPPDLFGFGLMEAIPEAAILARADPYDADGDGISGRAHMVGGVLGRFGRKAEGTDLDHFNARALLHEMGMTNSVFPVENSVGSWVIGGDSIPIAVDPDTTGLDLGDGDLVALNAYIRFLAAPPSTVPNTAEELEGQALFDSIGCAGCHTPQAYTTVSSTPSLNGKTVRAFSDFLVHDMGPQLGDICLGNAGPTEFRTEPLMGARHISVYMHDGRATTIGQAIYQHGGEAAAARDAYGNLSEAQREALKAYIRTL